MISSSVSPRRCFRVSEKLGYSVVPVPARPSFRQNDVSLFSTSLPIGFVCMEIWPAIDLRHGKPVRLRQGDYDQQTIFGDDPVEFALKWQAAGARQLHLVDLDA